MLEMAWGETKVVRGGGGYLALVPDHYLSTPRPVPELALDVVMLSVLPEGTPPEAIEMLRKVCGACGLEVDREAALMPIAGPTALAAALRDLDAAPAYVVVYGLSPAQVGSAWSAAAYAWLADGPTHWCFVEAPAIIAADPQRKRRLWDCLQRIPAERAADPAA